MERPTGVIINVIVTGEKYEETDFIIMSDSNAYGLRS